MKLVSSAGQTYTLDKPQILIGRSAKSDIVVPESRASSKHATIKQDGDAVILADSGSTNGTYVNEARIDAPVRLKLGDQIRIGDTVFRVDADSGKASVGDDATEMDVKFPPPPRPAAPPPMPAPPMPAAPPPPSAMVAPPPGYPVYPGYAPSLKDRSLVYILEILPGLVGFLGFGWIYAGQTSTGILFLAGNIMYLCIAGFITALTGGIALLCFWPLEVGVLIVSTILLSNHVNQHPELFR